MQEEEWIKVAAAPNETLALLMKGLLEDSKATPSRRYANRLVELLAAFSQPSIQRPCVSQQRHERNGIQHR